MPTTVTRLQATIKLDLRQGGDMKTVAFDVEIRRDLPDLAAVPGELSKGVENMLSFLSGSGGKERPAVAAPALASAPYEAAAIVVPEAKQEPAPLRRGRRSQPE